MSLLRIFIFFQSLAQDGGGHVNDLYSTLIVVLFFISKQRLMTSYGMDL